MSKKKKKYYTVWKGHKTGVFEKLPAHKLVKILRVPILGKLIARKIRKGLGIDSARLYGSGSAPISPSILQWYRTIGIDICEGWGMSETTGLSCTNMPFRADLVGTIGLPCGCVEMKLSDQGEILIRGDAVFKQYYKNSEATESSFVDGWFKSGDIARMDDEGFIYIEDRVKDMYISGGENVYPAEIEGLLYELDQIVEVAVIGIEDERWGETGCVCAVVKAGETLSLEDVLTHLDGRMAKFKLPSHVHLMAELPRGGTGKVLKFELRKAVPSLLG